MLNFTADARDGHASSVNACNTCCCEAVNMRRGETNLITINYAPWSLPIGWLVNSTFQYDVVHDESACATNEIDTFGPPVNTEYRYISVINAATNIDLTVNAGPAANPRTYSIVPLSGPSNGRISNFDANGTLIYTPNTGFNGYDYFTYEMCDRQGRCIRRNVQIAVLKNVANLVDVTDGQPDIGRMSTEPYIYMDRVKTNQKMHTVQFPIYMPLTARDCEVWTMTVQQRATDCDKNVYTHEMCFDFRVGKC